MLHVSLVALEPCIHSCNTLPDTSTHIKHLHIKHQFYKTRAVLAGRKAAEWYCEMKGLEGGLGRRRVLLAPGHVAVPRTARPSLDGLLAPVYRRSDRPGGWLSKRPGTSGRTGGCIYVNGDFRNSEFTRPAGRGWRAVFRMSGNRLTGCVLERARILSFEVEVPPHDTCRRRAARRTRFVDKRTARGASLDTWCGSMLRADGAAAIAGNGRFFARQHTSRRATARCPLGAKYRSGDRFQ